MPTSPDSACAAPGFLSPASIASTAQAAVTVVIPAATAEEIMFGRLQNQQCVHQECNSV